MIKKVILHYQHSPSCELEVDWASNFLKRARGLSFKKNLNHHGLLFSFNRPTRTPFWMWGMKIAIDLIWIKGDQVIGWEENLRPPRSNWSLVFPYFLKKYRPPKPVDQVLELPTGWGRKIMREDLVSLQIQ